MAFPSGRGRSSAALSIRRLASSRNTLRELTLYAPEAHLRRVLDF